MSNAHRVSMAICLLSSGVVTAGSAQNAPAAPPSVPQKQASVSVRQRNLSFGGGKAVLGLPLNYVTQGKSVCRSDGTTYLNISGAANADPTSIPDLYSVSTNAEVKRIPRKIPVGYGSLGLLDFYANGNTLLSLFRASKPVDAGTSRNETTYFLSTSDHDGDHANLTQLDLRFEPKKVAIFPSGHFLLLGWDRANLAQVMAILKEDGTLYRVFDNDTPKAEGAKPPQTYSSLREADASEASRTGQKLAGGAQFIPDGNRIFMTQRGTAAPVRIFSEFGEERPSLKLPMPSGYVLDQLLLSTPGNRYVLRVQSAEDFAKFDKEHIIRNPQQKLVESSPYGMREFLFDTPLPAAVTCAANFKITALFYDNVADSSEASKQTANAPARDGAAATQLVIATVPR